MAYFHDRVRHSHAVGRHWIACTTGIPSNPPANRTRTRSSRNLPSTKKNFLLSSLTAVKYRELKINTLKSYYKEEKEKVVQKKKSFDSEQIEYFCV